MKTFEYKCDKCKQTKELWLKEVPKENPKCCGKPMKRVYSSTFEFKCDMRR